MTSFCRARAGARSEDGRDHRQAEAGRRRHAEGDPAARIGRRARRADLAGQRARAVRREARRPPERPQHAQRRRRSQARRAADAARRARDAQELRATASATQMVDAQHKLDAVRALQTALVPLVAEVSSAEEPKSAPPSSASTARKFDRRRDHRAGEALRGTGGAEQGDRGRSRRAYPPDAGAGRGARRGRATIKDETARRARSRPGPAARHGRARSRRPKISSMRAEKMFKQLEQRRSQVAFGEKKLAAVEVAAGRDQAAHRPTSTRTSPRSPAASSWSTR